MRREHSNLFVRNHDYLHVEAIEAKKFFCRRKGSIFILKKRRKGVVQVGNFQHYFKGI